MKKVASFLAMCILFSVPFPSVFGGKVQCTTCHDVHDQEAVPGTRLLRSPQTIAQGGTTPSRSASYAT